MSLEKVVASKEGAEREYAVTIVNDDVVSVTVEVSTMGPKIEDTERVSKFPDPLGWQLLPTNYTLTVDDDLYIDEFIWPLDADLQSAWIHLCRVDPEKGFDLNMRRASFAELLSIKLRDNGNYDLTFLLPPEIF